MLNILLAAYNSEKFLKEQIDSILTQDYADFRLLIRDGGSSDSTLEIIAGYEAKDSRVRFIGSFRSKAGENFGALLEAAEGDLFMFADHDDVWLPDKVSRTLAKYRDLEAENTPDTPLMVFTDSIITDSALAVICGSMMKYQHLSPEKLKIPQLLLQNVPSGNTMLFNRALRDMSLPFPPDMVMHDAWLTLTASAFGRIAFLDVPTLYYRQHGSNVYGAYDYSLFSFFRKAARGIEKIRSRFYQNVYQAGAFLEKFRAELEPDMLDLLTDFSNLEKCGFWRKRYILLKHDIYKNGFLRNLGMFIVL